MKIPSRAKRVALIRPYSVAGIGVQPGWSDAFGPSGGFPNVIKSTTVPARWLSVDDTVAISGIPVPELIVNLEFFRPTKKLGVMRNDARGLDRFVRMRSVKRWPVTRPIAPDRREKAPKLRAVLTTQKAEKCGVCAIDTARSILLSKDSGVDFNGEREFRPPWCLFLASCFIYACPWRCTRESAQRCHRNDPGSPRRVARDRSRRARGVPRRARRRTPRRDAATYALLSWRCSHERHGRRARRRGS